MPYKDPEMRKKVSHDWYMKNRVRLIKRNNEMKRMRIRVQKYRETLSTVFDPEAVKRRDEFLKSKGVMV